VRAHRVDPLELGGERQPHARALQALEHERERPAQVEWAVGAQRAHHLAHTDEHVAYDGARSLHGLVVGYGVALASASFGIRALRAAGGSGVWDRSVAAVLALAGLAALLRGVQLGLPLWIIFGSGALLGGATRLRYHRRPAQRRAERVLQHIAGMGATCIATVTAFLVVNISNLGLDSFATLVWIAPGLLGGAAVRMATGRWQRRLAASASSSGGVVRT
jgi:hypothetical protein